MRRRAPRLVPVTNLVAVAVAVLVAVVVAGCSRPVTPRASSSGAGTQTADYLPGVAADLYLPQPRPARAPVVVLVPGGGWTTADRTGLAPLAGTLVKAGMVVLVATYRVSQDHVRFPRPVQDIACATAYAAQRARAAGVTPSTLVLVGHSAGAHLGALAALATDHFRDPACPAPTAHVDGFVGLAGPYDVKAFVDAAYGLFGGAPADDPALWHEADPLTWATRATPTSPAFLLVNGTADTTVPSFYSESFGRSLEAAGYRVRVDVVPRADHSTVFTPAVAGARIIAWVRGLRAP